MAHATLHIGTPKTGTTFLQRAMSDNNKALRAAGIVYPAFGTHQSHTALALAFNPREGDRHERWGVTDRVQTRKEISRTITSSLSSTGPNFLFSTESAARLSGDQVRELHSFLLEFFDELTVLVYLRRRDFMLASRYSQRIKNGSKNLTWKQAIKKLQTHEPNALLDRWASVVGQENVIARPFLESFKAANDGLLSDFAHQVGIPVGELVPPAPDDVKAQNSSLNAEGTELLRALNSLLPTRTTDGSQNLELRLRLIERILEITSGPPLRLPPEVLVRASERFSASDRELVTRLGSAPEWQEWLAQPAPQTAAPVAVPTLRTAELLTALSVPSGPLDYSQPDWRPRDWKRSARRRVAKIAR